MRTADGYPVVCYGTKGNGYIHLICRRCALYRPYSVPEKPCYRLEGIHSTGSRECPLFECKDASDVKNIVTGRNGKKFRNE